ncbi:hypothetical protein GCM10023088_17380 [Actinomadura verrucosospora]
MPPAATGRPRDAAPKKQMAEGVASLRGRQGNCSGSEAARSPRGFASAAWNSAAASCPNPTRACLISEGAARWGVLPASTSPSRFVMPNEYLPRQ